MKDFKKKIEEIQKILDTIDEIPVDISYTFRRDKHTIQLNFIKRR